MVLNLNGRTINEGVELRVNIVIVVNRLEIFCLICPFGAVPPILLVYFSYFRPLPSLRAQNATCECNVYSFITFYSWRTSERTNI